jgi:hypothetical protein
MVWVFPAQPLHVVVLHKYPVCPLPLLSLLFYAIDMVQSTADIPPDVLRLTAPEAARALGISPEAVHNRLSRGTLNSEKEEGTVYVLLPAEKVRYTDERLRYTDDRPHGTSRDILVIDLAIYRGILPLS